MKKKMVALGAALVAGAAWANRIVVTQDRESALYAVGEEAKFSVSVVDDAGVPLKDGSAKWTLDNFGSEKVANGQVSLAAGNPFAVTGTLAKPGFLRFRVNSGTNSAVWSVGYDVDRIRQDGTRPSDFGCYWRGEQQRYPEDYDGIIAGVPGNDRLARATGLWQMCLDGRWQLDTLARDAMR